GAHAHEQAQLAGAAAVCSTRRQQYRILPALFAFADGIELHARTALGERLDADVALLSGIVGESPHDAHAPRVAVLELDAEQRTDFEPVGFARRDDGAVAVFAFVFHRPGLDVLIE